MKNVLFVSIDDFRPEIAAEPFGRTYMSTPNFDDFIHSAGTSTFSRAHVQQAVCGPSRASFLTGRRPDTTHVYDIQTYFRDVGGPDWLTMPGYFKSLGYKVMGGGKTFHPGQAAGGNDDLVSWSERTFQAGDQFW